MNVLITGTSRGIGEAIALKFLQQGHCVTGIDREAASISDRHYTHVQTDIFSGDLPELPDTEILINNAGVQDSGMDIDINLKGTIRVTEKYALQEHIKSVLFIASASAQTGAEFPEYSASKGGMVAYMKNVALRIAKYGATSNSLSPGGVITSLNDHILSNPSLWKQVMDETLLPKWATVDEIAEWAYFVTVINKSMTAQDILIDNGEAAKSNFIW
ncbi:MAG: SDR family oxidoreductase [Lachnospiraceae bacterium]|nr:SDR family oxidoreductase [Lachnospiraceae bacterium]